MHVICALLLGNIGFDKALLSMLPKSLCCEKQPMQSVWAVEWAWGWDYAVPVARRLHGFSFFFYNKRGPISCLFWLLSANKLHVGALRGRAASVF